MTTHETVTHRYSERPQPKHHPDILNLDTVLFDLYPSHHPSEHHSLGRIHLGFKDPLLFPDPRLSPSYEASPELFDAHLSVSLSPPDFPFHVSISLFRYLLLLVCKCPVGRGESTIPISARNFCIYVSIPFVHPITVSVLLSCVINAFILLYFPEHVASFARPLYPHSSFPASCSSFSQTHAPSLQHALHPIHLSPLHSPLPSPPLEATITTSCHYQHNSDTAQLHSFSESDLEQPGYFNMVKKRRSLQSILIPPFLQSHTSNDASPSPTQSARIRSHSAAASTSSFVLPPPIPVSIPECPAPPTPAPPLHNSPPSDLLDDDPFADLSTGPSVVNVTYPRSRTASLSRISTTTLDVHSSIPVSPRSPLSQHSFARPADTFHSSFDASSRVKSPDNTPFTPPSTPILKSESVRTPKRPWSSGHGQARPAYTRPAFKPRPSLPSLHVLAQAQVVIPKVRRGRVGAQLPYEPWQSQSSESIVSRDDEEYDSVDTTPGVNISQLVREKPSHSRRPSGLTTIRDSRIINGTLSSSPTEFPSSSASQIQHMAQGDVNRDILTNIPETDTSFHGDFNIDDPIPLVRTTAPGLTRAHSEPSPSLRPLSALHPDPLAHTRSSLPSEESGTLPYDIPSPPSSPTAMKRKPSWGCYSTAFPTHKRFTHLPAAVADEWSLEDVFSHLDSSPSHTTLEAIGYSVPGQGTPAEGTEEDDFEPGTSAETIRMLSPSHRRTPSNYSQQSQTLEWRPSSDFLTGLPVSPSSTSSSSDRSSSSENEQLAYDLEAGDHIYQDQKLSDALDFLTFHSDSSEESLSPTLMSLSLSTSESTASTSAARTPPSSSGPTPYNSIYEDLDAPFELDEDVVHMLPPLPRSPKRPSRSSSLSSSEYDESKYVTAVEEPMDAGDGTSGGGGGGGRRSDHQGSYGGAGNGRWQGAGDSSGSRGGGSSYGNGGGHGGGRDDDDRWNRRPSVRTAVPVTKDSETSDEEDDYGRDEEVQRSPVRTRAYTRQTRSRHESETDDDVPLAQQIPTALKAQKTIRRQVRDEIDLRRKESRRRPETKQQTPVSQSPPVQITSRTRGSFNHDAAVLSNTREALLPPAPADKPLTRPRTKTLPSNSMNPFSAHDLKAKLLGVQSSDRHIRQPSDELASRAPQMSLRDAHSQTTATPGSLRPQRSFHRPRTIESELRPLPPPMPLDVNVKLGRSATSASKCPPHPDMQHGNAGAHFPSSFSAKDDGGFTGLERSRTSRTTSSRRPSVENRDRSSGEHESPAQQRRPPMPPLPSTEVVNTFSSPAPPPPKQTWQQRVFIGNLQRYCQIEVGASTTAGDVLRIMESQDAFPGGSAMSNMGGWMLWESCHDFGMERPMRSFELLTSVSGSWVADKSTNAFMAKRTPLARVLSRSAIPSSSPMCSGYVQHEYKRGKWQKRWMELREHSLWLSKKDNGKDQICVCHLANFDAYMVTRVHKAPKGHMFAVKSTDNLSFFENTSDYMHMFSCGEKEGANWLEKILLARSYVLHQERNVLSNTSISATSTGGGASLSRAGTRKRPAQPLLNIGHVATPEVPISPAVFEPGSLLAKRAA